MLPSVIVNLVLAVCAVAAVVGHTRQAPLKVLLRYYTVLSNLLCAAAAVTVAVCRLSGGVPNGVLIFKYVGTGTVTLTMLTVLAFLGPTLGWKLMFSGPDLWLHLICPVLAIASYLFWDRPSMPFPAVWLCVATVVVYGAMYIYRVLRAPETHRWKDFYGFNRGGKWPISYVVMLIAMFAISAALWAFRAR